MDGGGEEAETEKRRKVGQENSGVRPKNNFGGAFSGGAERLSVLADTGDVITGAMIDAAATGKGTRRRH